jgi:hypothetical protein
MGRRLRDSNEPRPHTLPTTRPEDYSAVVDVYKCHEEENDKRCKEMIVSVVCPVSKYGFEKSHGNEMEPILWGGIHIRPS